MSRSRCAAIALLLGLALAFARELRRQAEGRAARATRTARTAQVCVDNKCVECTDDAHCAEGKKCSAERLRRRRPSAPRTTSARPARSARPASASRARPTASAAPAARARPARASARTKCAKDEDCADDEDCVNGFCLQAPAATASSDGACPLATVYFGFDDSSIQASERDRLDGNAQCIEKTKGKAVFLIGHTDTSGTEEYNIALSERRAQSVADYLSRLGSDPARMQVVPKGETEPTGLGDDKDRRVRVPVALKAPMIMRRARARHVLALGRLLLGHDQERGRGPPQGRHARSTTGSTRRSRRSTSRSSSSRRSSTTRRSCSSATARTSAPTSTSSATTSAPRTAWSPRSTTRSTSSRSRSTYRKATTRARRASSSASPRSRAASRARTPSPDDLWKLGSTAFEAARYNEAIEIFKRLVAELPDARRAPTTPQYFRGQSYTNLKDWDKAIGVVPAARRQVPRQRARRRRPLLRRARRAAASRTAPRRAPTSASSSRSTRSRTSPSTATDLDAALKKDAKNKAKCSS